MIDTDITVEARFFRRWLTVGRMKEILDQLEDSDVLAPNRVGNLSVIRSSEYEHIGQIDLNTEEFEDFSEDEEGQNEETGSD